MTICTRAAETPRIAWTERAISPSSARTPGDFLHEGGDAERAEIVEQFVAGIGAVGQPLLGQQHARPRRLRMRHHHGIAGGI